MEGSRAGSNTGMNGSAALEVGCWIGARGRGKGRTLICIKQWLEWRALLAISGSCSERY